MRCSRRLFVRNRDGDLLQAQRANARDRFGEVFRWHVEGEVGGVGPRRLEGGIVHRWRARMARRMKHDPAKPGGCTGLVGHDLEPPKGEKVTGADSLRRNLLRSVRG